MTRSLSFDWTLSAAKYLAWKDLLKAGLKAKSEMK
jgi:hypothetical protein